MTTLQSERDEGPNAFFFGKEMKVYFFVESLLSYCVS